MNIKQFISEIWIPAALTLLYLLLLNFNAGNDAWAYASSAKWGTELFSPHHLLYNSIGRITAYFLNSLGFQPEYLRLMQSINALICGLSLYILGLILKINYLNLNSVRMAQIITGMSFVVFRFATENETYIFPVFFMLLAILFWKKSIQKFQNHNRKFLIAGMIMSVAVLFHQQQIMSLLALGVFILLTEKRKHTFIFICPALILIPAAYILAWIYEPLLQSPWHYFFHDFYSGSASLNPGLKQYLLIPVSLFRVYIQVHGNIFSIVKSVPVLGIFAFMGMILFTISFIWGMRKFIRTKAGFKTTSIQKLFLSSPVCLLFLFHILFALWFGANQEFMVPLPFLGILIMTHTFQIKFQDLYWKGIAAGLLFWNISVAGIPQRFLILDPSAQLSSKIIEMPDAVWVLYEESRIRHILYYQTGIQAKNLLHGPEWYQQVQGNSQTLTDTLTTLLQNNVSVLTDCPDRPFSYSRAYLLKAGTENFWESFEKNKVLEIQTITGDFPIHSLHLPRALTQVK